MPKMYMKKMFKVLDSLMKQRLSKTYNIKMISVWNQAHDSVFDVQ